MMQFQSRSVRVSVGIVVTLAAALFLTACPPPTDPNGGDDPETVTTLVSGTISDSLTSLPIDGALVTSGVLFASSNAAGAYSLSIEHEGSFTLDISKTDYGSVTETITTEAATAEHNFALVYAGAEALVSGRVYFPDTEIPVEGALVSVGTHTDTSDAAGEFQVVGVPLGSYDFTVVKTGFTTYADTLDVLAPADVTVELAGGPVNDLTGNVSNSIAAGVGGVAVVLLNPGGGDSQITTATDISGDYTLAAVPDGSRTVSFTATYYAATDEAVVAANGATHDVVLDADPVGPPTLIGATASGSVPRTISVMWSAPLDDTFASVNIYRSTNPDSGYTKVNAGVETSAPYVDSFSLYGTYGTYYYKVTSLNIDGDESGMTGYDSADSGPLETGSSTSLAGTYKRFLDSYYSSGLVHAFIDYDTVTPANSSVYIGIYPGGPAYSGTVSATTPVGVAGYLDYNVGDQGVYVLGSDGTVYIHVFSGMALGAGVAQSYSAPGTDHYGMASREVNRGDRVTDILFFLSADEDIIYEYNSFSDTTTNHDFSAVVDLPRGDIDYKNGKIILAEEATTSVLILQLSPPALLDTIPMPQMIAGLGWDEGAADEIYMAAPTGVTITKYLY